MDISLLLAQFMSGLARGTMLFLVASGLSLIFGVMNILNFAHASLWLVGAYFCHTFWLMMENYGFGLWVSIPMAALTLAGIGWLIEVVLIRRVYNRELPEQLLLTYAMVLIIGDLLKLFWGVEDRIITRPALVERTGLYLRKSFRFLLHLRYPGWSGHCHRPLVVYAKDPIWPYRQGRSIQPGDGGSPGHPYTQDLYRGLRFGYLYRGFGRGRSGPGRLDHPGYGYGGHCPGLLCGGHRRIWKSAGHPGGIFDCRGNLFLCHSFLAGRSPGDDFCRHRPGPDHPPLGFIRNTHEDLKMGVSR